MKLIELTNKLAEARKLREQGKYIEASHLEYYVRVMINARFPNPTVCPACGQKIIRCNQ